MKCASTAGNLFEQPGRLSLALLEGTSIPLLRDVRVDGLAMLFVASMAMLTGVGIGILPALQASGFAPQEALKDSGRGMTSGGGWMGRALVVTEIVLVCILLTGAGLLTRSLGRVLDVDPGFTAEQVMSLRVDPSIGLPAAWMAARAIQGLLFGVVSSDPVTFGGLVVVVAIVAGLAGYVPARQASRIDPVLALRSD